MGGSMGRRVAITGIGVLSPVGIGAANFWRSLCEGTAGIGPLTRFDASACASRIAGEVKDFNPERFINRRKLPYLSRSSQFALAAGKLALSDAGLDHDDASAWAVALGSGNAGFDVLETQAFLLQRAGLDKVDPMAAPGGSCATPAAALSIELGAHGETQMISTACSSGLNALAYGFRQVSSGQADVSLAGGVETPLVPTIHSVISAGKTLSGRNDDPARASRPFDRDRDGYVLAEGAALFVLEDLGHALRRGARIYAEAAGAGVSSDGYSMLRLHEGGEHLAAAMKRAMDEARLNPEDIDEISAHGSSSRAGDARETRAIKMALGPRARAVWISAVKSMIGMALGAGGALQAAACTLSIHHGVVPPTINYEHPDPECDLDYVPNSSRERAVGAALVNSTGMGGTNVCLALKSPKALCKAAVDGADLPGLDRERALCPAAGGTPAV
jgi:3-oxoacyl-[acyl-carrier-protein] synthase II